MAHPYSLAFLTTSEVSPVEAIKIAAETGYDFVGLRFLPSGSEAAYPIMTDKEMQKEAARALEDTGVKLADIEIARLGPKTVVNDFEPFCALGQQLGARHVLVAGDDPKHSRLTDTFGEFCRLASTFELTADLEFMPWTAIKNLKDALKIVEGADCNNGGVLIDALHYDRSDSTLEDVKNLPASRINYAQICDGPVPYDPSDAGLIHIARAERLLPGDGGIDLVGLVQALPPDVTISVEIPQHKRAQSVPAEQRAAEALQRTKTLFA